MGVIGKHQAYVWVLRHPAQDNISHRCASPPQHIFQQKSNPDFGDRMICQIGRCLGMQMTDYVVLIKQGFSKFSQERSNISSRVWYEVYLDPSAPIGLKLFLHLLLS